VGGERAPRMATVGVAVQPAPSTPAVVEAKAAEDSAEISWACERCTYHNQSDAEACSLCGLGRDGRDCSFCGGSQETEEQPGVRQGVTLFAVIPCRLKPVLNGALRGVFALVGSFAGAVAGAVAAQPSRGGIFRAIGLGALAGAIVSVEALETSQFLFDGDGGPPGHRAAREPGDADLEEGSSAETGGEPPAALGFLSRLGGLQISLFHWGTAFTVDSGLENALRELRLPPDALLRVTSAAGQGARYSYPTSDADGTARTGVSVLVDGRGHRPAGLTPGQLRKVPFKCAAEMKGQCAICFEGFKAGEHVRVLPHCDHSFHARCLDPWLKSKGSCPMCRSEVLGKGTGASPDLS